MNNQSSYCNNLSSDGCCLTGGITIGAAASRVRRTVPLIFEDAENGLSARMYKTIAELYDLFNDHGRRINFLIKKSMLCSGNLRPASVSSKLKALDLKRLWPLLRQLAIKMVVTLLHDLVWFHGNTQVATGRY